ncbi:hypothetical protein CERZMDRAFT_111854 [Cercospora zeae-maydis SCOH1-5]|uniref:Heme haloperoxidase family profile domain-containing protein n=1 Tax=Cercospora zeae-maydis SCOH1-5 TaxID=717836 RepID=A0A6A6FHT0_9PEZI|nr:hypothetical protein CERZMDRAFT_111854 [Cercospora zeae-maydis SCOH1-5]
MVQSRKALLSALPLAAAYPWAMEASQQLQKRQEVEPPAREPLFLSGRSNTSPLGAPVFNAEDQFVDVSEGSGHEFQAPGPGDIRGQCPGLNAVANHRFFPSNGIVDIATTVTGLAEAYGMSPDLSLFLAVLSVGISGDPVAGTWSIGGEYRPTVPLLTGRASGIASTHNQYESDASIVRGDAFLNDGFVGAFQMRSWEHFYEMGEEYTLDMAAAQSDYVTRWSIANNPYYFSAPFAGLVAPAAHNFVINFMSNRSEENPGGVLTRDVLKSFFSVTGDAPGEFVHTPGHERIPDNWYRRSTLVSYNIAETVNDVQVNNAMYPGIIRFGGNTGTTNSFAGVDLTDLTGGVFNLATLAEGNNAACFFLQASQQGIPDVLDPALGAIGSVAAWVAQQLGPMSEQLGCPELASFESSFFDQFPGASFQAEDLSRV